MNERIKELADLAQRHAEFTTPQGLEWLDTFKDKFAELIVKETLRITGATPSMTETAKKHFGVEK